VHQARGKKAAAAVAIKHGKEDPILRSTVRMRTTLALASVVGLALPALTGALAAAGTAPVAAGSPARRPGHAGTISSAWLWCWTVCRLFRLGFGAGRCSGARLVWSRS
jgi:hypothetical protein